MAGRFQSSLINSMSGDMDRHQLKELLLELDRRLENAGKLLRIEDKRRRIGEIELMMQDGEFWQDKDGANRLMQELKAIRQVVEPWEGLSRRVKEDLEMLEIADEVMLEGLVEDAISARDEVEKLERQTLFTGRFDENNAILEIQAGAGGTEACDWANMLMRMYVRWAEKNGFEAHTIHLLAGEEAGIKSVSLLIKGPYAYGHLKAERGVHRLVRISPFDANKRRHTSFASVDVVPEIEEDIDVEIKEEDLRIDVFRGTGPGGQSVNTTDSAVRIVHLPTGITITCRNERSQLQNKQTALRMLKARLYELEEQKRQQELDKERGEKKKIEWGSQIRSYVMQPYTMVKDHRTGVETSNVEAVLDGEINEFIFGWLQWVSSR